MAREEDITVDELVDTFKSRGLTCRGLESKEKLRIRLAKEARKDGFIETAKMDEEVARRLRQVRKKVCRLK